MLIKSKSPVTMNQETLRSEENLDWHPEMYLKKINF
jgi:hypothetical protein